MKAKLPDTPSICPRSKVYWMSILYFPGLQKYVCKVVNSENSDGEAIVCVLERWNNTWKVLNRKLSGRNIDFVHLADRDINRRILSWGHAISFVEGTIYSYLYKEYSVHSDLKCSRAYKKVLEPPHFHKSLQDPSTYLSSHRTQYFYLESHESAFPTYDRHVHQHS